MSTPDIKSTEEAWQEIFHHRIYSHPHLEAETDPVDTIFDIGANVGIFAAWAAQEYAPQHIYCYEASPITFQYLQRNIKKLSKMHNSTMFHATLAAVSNTDGDERQIYHHHNRINTSTILEEGRDLGGSSFIVHATRLSQQIAEREVDVIDLLKIDVEGHYMQVLQGISDFTRIRRIVLECDWIPQGAASHHSVIEFLQEKGYSVVLDDPAKQNNIIVYARQTHPLHIDLPPKT